MTLSQILDIYELRQPNFQLNSDGFDVIDVILYCENDKTWENVEIDDVTLARAVT